MSELFKIWRNRKDISKLDFEKYGDKQIELFSLIKIIEPDKYQKFIVIGDIHGSFATFIRILLRFRIMNIMDQNCKFLDNYHIIFLGDIIDRGVYGYETLMLIYCLNILNPTNVHVNRGNHEDYSINSTFGFLEQIKIQFDNDELVSTKMNTIMLFQSSAILIKNPINNKYIYLAHGGLPTETLVVDDKKSFKILDDFKDFGKENLIISNEIGEYVRWNDFESIKESVKSLSRGDASSLVIGYDLINKAKELGIELIIRGHQDYPINTKLLPLLGESKTKFTQSVCSIC